MRRSKASLQGWKAKRIKYPGNHNYREVVYEDEVWIVFMRDNVVNGFEICIGKFIKSPYCLDYQLDWKSVYHGYSLNEARLDLAIKNPTLDEKDIYFAEHMWLNPSVLDRSQLMWLQPMPDRIEDLKKTGKWKDGGRAFL